MPMKNPVHPGRPEQSDLHHHVVFGRELALRCGDGVSHEFGPDQDGARSGARLIIVGARSRAHSRHVGGVYGGDGLFLRTETQGRQPEAVPRHTGNMHTSFQITMAANLQAHRYAAANPD